jgi:mannose-6-phosphate isomerase-like protein (cupin superfamily)
MQNSYKSILLKHNLVLKKCFGQNFIFDEEYLDKLVEKAGVSNLDTVVEIGCGAGTLTRSIAKKAKRVIGYEIDTRLKPILDDVCKEHKNVSINYLDIMKENISALEKRIGGEYIVVANLPYYITTPIIMNFLEIERREMDVDFDMSEPHSHDYYELYFLFEGSRAMFLQDKMFVLPPNTFCVIPPFCLHKTDTPL